MPPNSPSRPAYRRIADALQSLIRTSAFKPGDRLPSIRQISIAHRVSVPTAQRALEELEVRGHVDARARAGYYVRARALTQLAQRPEEHMVTLSGTTELARLVHTVYAVSDRPGICPLGPDGPSPELYPTQKLNRALGSTLRRSTQGTYGYSELAGSLVLRNEIARRSPASGHCLTAEEIVVTAGCTDALHLCLQAVSEPGDLVAVESPGYYGVLLALHRLRRRVLLLPVDPHKGLLPEVVEEAVRQHPLAAVVLSANFNNPHGALIPEKNKQRMVATLADAGIPIVEDDIYGDLHFGASRPPPLKAYDREGMVLLCDSFSKTIAPGYRVGWTAPGRYLSRVLEIKFSQTNFSPQLSQAGVAEFLRLGGYERHVRKLRATYARHVELMAKAVAEHFPEGTVAAVPQGGHFLWVQLPKSVDALALHAAAAARNINFAPGPMFSPGADQHRHHLRLNCARIWTPEIEKAIAILGQLATAEMR